MEQFGVLIVEDEYALARALSHTVKKSFPCSQVDIAGDGVEGLHKLAANSYSLIISDWNMPNKTGQELLTDVRECDNTKSIPFLMLTGRSDRASVSTAVKHGANAYLVKPFVEAHLLDKIEELTGISRIELPNSASTVEPAPEDLDAISIIDNIAKDLKTGNIKFPILSEVAFKITELFSDDEQNLDRIVDTLKLDPSIAPKLIALSNSAFYKTAKHITNLEEAVARLGLKQTKEVALMAVNHSLFNFEDSDFEEVLTTLWCHGIAVASCAKHIGHILSAEEPDILYLMGMLHDIGKLLLIQQIQEKHPNIEPEAAREVIQSLHSNAGAAVLKAWELPIDVVNAALLHHDIPVIEDSSLPLRIIHFADVFSRTLGYSLQSINTGEMETLCEQLQLGLTTKQLSMIAEEANKEVAKIRSAM